MESNSAHNNSLNFRITPATVFISTNPDQASYANISVSIENSGPALNVSSIAITLPLQLAPASSLNSITPVAGQVNMWNFNASQINNGEFDATPQSGAYVVMNNGDSWLFTLQMATLVSTITQPFATVTTSVNLNDGSSIPASMNVDIKSTTSSISFNSQPANINPGESTTLNWQCEQMDYCIISPIDNSHRHPSDSVKLTPDSTTVYTLYSYGHGGGVILSAQWTISVDNAQVTSFGVTEGQTIVNYGDCITLQWLCNQFTESITLNDNTGVIIPDLLRNGNTPQKGSVKVGPILTQTQFTFTAFGKDKSTPDQRPLTISINDVEATFSVTPDQGLWEHDAVTLQWNITSASSVDLSPNVVGEPSLTNLSGSVIVNPDSNTTYTLTVQGLKDNSPITLQPISIPLNVQNIVINYNVIKPSPGEFGLPWYTWSVTAEVVHIDGYPGPDPGNNGGIELAHLGKLTAGTKQHPDLHSILPTVINEFT